MSARGGIDLGGTKIQAVVVNGRGSVVGDSRHPTPTKGGPAAVAAQMAAALSEAADAAGIEPSPRPSVGVAPPGGLRPAGWDRRGGRPRAQRGEPPRLYRALPRRGRAEQAARRRTRV